MEHRRDNDQGQRRNDPSTAILTSYIPMEAVYPEDGIRVAASTPDGARGERTATASSHESQSTWSTQVTAVTAGGSTADDASYTRPDGSDYGDYANCLSVAKGAVPALRVRIQQLRMKDGYNEEFKRIPTDKLYPWTGASRCGVKAKNRFMNILPYDKNRVRLSYIPGQPLSDYINASHITGFGCRNNFIASQGPTYITTPDFWRMLWEQDAGLIVVFTNLVQSGKTRCAKYWPDKTEEVTHGDMAITLVSEDSWPDVTIRTLRVAKEGYEERVVEQCHYTSWPDHGVPEDATSILRFHKRVRQRMIPGKPTVVHCSAGVGATGTFIAIDYLLKQAEDEGKVDVFKCVSNLRQQKIWMVKTKKQYEFIYTSVLEALTMEDTEIACGRMASYLADAADNMQKQFQTLDETKPSYSEGDRSLALNQNNQGKNRDFTILPRLGRRVVLTSRPEGRNDYINAVFVDGYGKKNAFVATQMPTEGAVVDLWRMIYDYQCGFVILLGENMKSLLPDDKDGYTVVGQYHLTTNAQSRLPETDDIQQTLLQVDKVEPERLDEHGTAMGSLTVACRVLQVSATHTTDLSATLLTRLYAIVRDATTDRCGYVVFVCRDGALLSGVVIASFSMFDMMRLDNTVDVFQVTRRIKESRPEFIRSLDQYKQLHEVAREYTKQSAIYANMY